MAGHPERAEALEPFYPDRMASRILGMGDIVSLVEMAQENINVEEAEELQRKMRKKELNLQDFLDQFQKVKKMGPLKDLLGMIPGMGSMAGQVDEKQIRRIEANSVSHIRFRI